MGRMARVNQLIKREVSQIIQQDINDPRLEFITITNADVSPDLHHAKISYSVLGGNSRVAEVQEALLSATSYIRKLVSQRVRIRYIPAFEFEFDRSVEYSARIEQTLNEIHRNENNENNKDKKGDESH